MTDEATTDMLMQFESAKGGPIAAECPLAISPNDTLATNTQLSKGLIPGKYFLVSQFAFSAELHDNEKAPANGKGGSGQGAGGGGGGGGAGGPRLGGSLGGTGFAGASFGGGAGGTRGGALGRGGDHFDDFSALTGPGGGSGGSGGAGSDGSGGKGAQGGSGADGKKTGAKRGGSFARWRSATDDSWKADGTYPAYINEFSFTRLIDMASPVLFDFCCRKESFPFVTFIKRKAAIAGSSTEPESLAYLRIDLANVLLTSIRWSDGDIVEETCQMKCQKMRIIYWQQNFDSTLIPIGAVDWASPVISPSSTGS